MFTMKRDVYDAIDLVSEAEGGLMRTSPYTCGDGETLRCGCMIGAAHFAGVYGDTEPFDENYPTSGAYASYDANRHLTPSVIDFDAAHRELSPLENARLPWSQIAAQMGVVRGVR